MTPVTSIRSRSTPPRIAGLRFAAMGVVVFAGGMLGNEWHKSVPSGAVVTKVNTAVGLLLAGAMLCLLYIALSPRRRLVLASRRPRAPGPGGNERDGRVNLSAFGLSFDRFGFSESPPRCRGWRAGGSCGKNAGFVRPILWLPVGLIGGALVFGGVFYLWGVNRIRASTLSLTEARAEMLARTMERDAYDVAVDLVRLATGDSFNDYLETGEARSLDRAIGRAVLVSKVAENYDQIRYISEHGMEVFRVERGGRIVPAAALQDKFGRDYFQRTAQLARGSVHLSAVDLNIEHGVVEEPFRPVWRFSMPVFDALGRRRGIYVVNYLAEGLFEDLRTVRPDLFDQLRILNPNGYWIKGADPLLEWGFAIPGRSAATLSRSDPVLWKRLLDSPGGILAESGRMLAWYRVDVASPISRRIGAVSSEEPFLIVALELAGASHDALFSRLRGTMLAMTTALVVLAFFLGRTIAGRMESARALRRSEESLSVTLSSIGDAVLATDTSGHVTRMNRIAEKLTGWPLEEAMDRHVGEILRIINEKTREPAVIPVEGVLATGEIQGIANHTILIARDGVERPIADSAAPIRGRSGVIAGVVMVFRDVSVERAAREALSESEARYRTLFEQIDEGFCIIEMIYDPEGTPVDYRFLEINPSFENQTGLADAVGKRMREIAPSHEEHWFEIYGHIAKTGESRRFQNRAEQLHRTYDVYAFRFGDPARRQVAILFNDITERDHTERQVARLNADLQLQAAQLEAANRELEAFSYSVSHDLRAPLRHVQGYVEMLMRDSQEVLSEKSRRFLRTIAESARDMGRLIDDLLSFSRMGRAELREEVVDLNTLVAEVRGELAPAMHGRDIRWTIPALPAVRGDHAMLKQVLANLLDNAVKYTRRRNPAEIGVGWTRGDDGKFEFHVRDNGAGFDMKYADKLFGVFQRLHRADEFEGTGVGLANVRRIIARHGGNTRAEGRVESGATFYFSLSPADAEPVSQSHP